MDFKEWFSYQLNSNPYPFLVAMWLFIILLVMFIWLPVVS